MSTAKHVGRSDKAVQTVCEQRSEVQDQTATERGKVREVHDQRLESKPPLQLPPGKPNVIGGSALMLQDPAPDEHIQYGSRIPSTRLSSNSKSDGMPVIKGKSDGTAVASYQHSRSLRRHDQSLSSVSDKARVLKQGSHSTMVERDTSPPRFSSMRDVYKETGLCSTPETTITQIRPIDHLKWKTDMTACLVRNTTRACTPFSVPLDDARNCDLKSRLEYYHSKELEVIHNIRRGLQGQQEQSLYNNHVQQVLNSLREQIKLDRQLEPSSRDVLFKTIRTIENLAEEVSKDFVNSSACTQ